MKLKKNLKKVLQILQTLHRMSLQFLESPTISAGKTTELIDRRIKKTSVVDVFLFRELLLHDCNRGDMSPRYLAKSDIASNIPFGLFKRYRVVINREMEAVSTFESCGSAGFIAKGFTEAWNVLTWEKPFPMLKLKGDQEE